MRVSNDVDDEDEYEDEGGNSPTSRSHPLLIATCMFIAPYSVVAVAE